MSKFIVALLGLVSFNLFADDFVKPRMGAKPVFHDENGNPVYKLIDLESRFDNSFGVSPMVYQGTKSVDGEFPEVGFLGFCTATAVAPKILYTAAHCISRGQGVNWKMRFNGVTYKAVCDKHPAYNDSSVFNDYAFCILDQKLPEDTVFASFDTKRILVKGDEVLLNGFGAPNLGQHYWGKAVVRGLSGQDVITEGPANLGGGDSGGSLLAWTVDRIDPSKHIILGTNSRAGGGRSYFNATSHPNFRPYAESVEKKCGTGRDCQMCGISADCSKPIDPTSCADEQKYVSYVSGELILAEDALKICRSSL